MGSRPLLPWEEAPGKGGVELCRWSWGTGTLTPPYVNLLTSRSVQDDILAGLESCADDYVTKPFNHYAELRTYDKGG
jgi:DNA-binding response OmpR family regulator